MTMECSALYLPVSKDQARGRNSRDAGLAMGMQQHLCVRWPRSPGAQLSEQTADPRRARWGSLTADAAGPTRLISSAFVYPLRKDREWRTVLTVEDAARP